MCSMWLRAVLGEMTRRCAICLLDSPWAASRSTSTSRAVRPAGRSGRRAAWLAWPATDSTASTASASIRPAVTSARSCAAASRAGRAARIPRAVEPLAELHRDRSERRQPGRLTQHPLGEVGKQADPLPFAGAEGARLVPDRVRHAEPAQAMDQAGLAQGLHVGFGPAQLTAGRGGVPGYGAGVAERAGRLQVHEVGHAE